MTTALKVMDGDSARRGNHILLSVGIYLQFSSSNFLTCLLIFTVRDSMEGWREAVLAVDAFLGWKQVICLCLCWLEPDFDFVVVAGVAPSGDCRHNHGGLSDDLVHRFVGSFVQPV